MFITLTPAGAEQVQQEATQHGNFMVRSVQKSPGKTPEKLITSIPKPPVFMGLEKAGTLNREKASLVIPEKSTSPEIMESVSPEKSSS